MSPNSKLCAALTDSCTLAANNPKYNDYFKRLNSLHAMLTPDQLVHSDLAKAGFYCVRNEDIVACFQCGVRIGDWENGDDPLKEHNKLSPRCTYANLLSKVHDFRCMQCFENPSPAVFLPCRHMWRALDSVINSNVPQEMQQD